MIFKIQLYGISRALQFQADCDCLYFFKLIFRDSEKTTPKFVCNSNGCLLENSFTWIDEKPIDEGDILTVELFNLKKSSIRKISSYQTLMESYSPYRVYYLSEQLENGITFNFSLYYDNHDNDLLINSYNGQQIASSQFNCKPFNFIDFAHYFKQSDSKAKMISYGTFNKV